MGLWQVPPDKVVTLFDWLFSIDTSPETLENLVSGMNKNECFWENAGVLPLNGTSIGPWIVAITEAMAELKSRGMLVAESIPASALMEELVTREYCAR